ncbi:MAG: lipopolysaccharide transport periplasmic protein LptA [Desulfobacterales bacterium]|nr:lipopolysaccharide transport periplasmic protein LptA [Desulfobacterales bacterium]
MITLGHRSLLLLYMISIIGLLAPSAAWTEDLNKGGAKFPGQSIVIRSDTLEIDNQKKTVVFSGNVDAKREDLAITCQKMVLYYDELPTIKAGDKTELKIDRIIASGGVKITRPDGSSATAEQATYYQDSEKVVLTGKPKVTQRNDSVEGSVITLFLRENRSTVEGSGDQKVRAIIAPRDVKR